MRIVGCLMCHDNESYIAKTIEDLSKYTDEIYVNLNDPTEGVDQIISSSNKVKEVIRTTNEGRWSQGLQRDNTIRMLDDIKPDIVLFPDDDETFPKNFHEQLDEFWEDKEAKTFWLRLLYLWGDKYHFRNDGLFKRIHHVRAFKWQENIRFKPYAGYACPTTFINLPKNTRFNSNMPMLHWGYVNEVDRQRKTTRNNCSWCDDKHREEIDKGKIIVETPKFML